MVLAPCCWVDTGQLGEGDPRAGHGGCDGDDAVQQGDGTTRLDGDGEGGGNGDPAIGDVVADGDDVEDAEFALHGGCAGEVGDHLAGG